MTAGLARAQSGLDVAYLAAGPGDHPLSGCRVPDLASAGGTVFGDLVSGRAVLLNFAGPDAFPLATEAAEQRGILVRAAESWPRQKLAVVLRRPSPPIEAVAAH